MMTLKIEESIKVVMKQAYKLAHRQKFNNVSTCIRHDVSNTVPTL